MTEREGGGGERKGGERERKRARRSEWVCLACEDGLCAQAGGIRAARWGSLATDASERGDDKATAGGRRGSNAKPGRRLPRAPANRQPRQRAAGTRGPARSAMGSGIDLRPRAIRHSPLAIRHPPFALRRRPSRPRLLPPGRPPRGCHSYCLSPSRLRASCPARAAFQPSPSHHHLLTFTGPGPSPRTRTPSSEPPPATFPIPASVMRPVGHAPFSSPLPPLS